MAFKSIVLYPIQPTLYPKINPIMSPLVLQPGSLFSDLMKHVQSKMTKIPGGWQCRECPFNSKYTTTVRRHIEAKHLSEIVNCCQVCGKVCSTSDALKRHQKSHFLEDYQNDYEMKMDWTFYQMNKIYSIFFEFRWNWVKNVEGNDRNWDLMEVSRL